ncbi:hypothetical protein Dimus_031540, partial [Dionaea muscipula]
MEEIGMPLAKVGSRRSSRLSGPSSSSCSDLAIVKTAGLSPVAEVVGSEGELSEETIGAMPGLIDGLSAIDGVRQLPVMEESGAEGVFVHLPATGEAAQTEFGAVAVADDAMVDGGVDVADDGEGMAVGGGGLAAGNAMGDVASAADVLCCSEAIDSDLAIDPDSVSLPHSSVSIRVVDGNASVSLPHFASVCLTHHVDAVDIFDGGKVNVTDSGGLVCDGRVGQCDGGSVSEEVRAASAVREALRSQPTDGLRQSPSASAVPVSGISPVLPVSDVIGVGGQDDSRGCRSYAHVVQVDRRADVELSYFPPVDGGNTIFMEESDGDTFPTGLFAFW